MKSQLKRTLHFILLLLIIVSVANAQQLSLSGSVFQYNPQASSPFPVSESQVYIYNKQKGWIGPAITDRYGRFAFYDLQRGDYLLQIYFPGDPNPIWRQQIQVPGKLQPIVLR